MAINKLSYSSNKIGDFIKKYSNIEIELILAHVVGKSREFVFMNPAHELTRKQAHELTRIVKRRMAGEPMAYILGYKDFYGFRFKVNKNVLIPRPETESIVDGVILTLSLTKGKNLKNEKRSFGQSPQDDAGIIKIVDIGTGSGCIAISLAKALVIHKSKFIIYASDISPLALKVAKQNAKNILEKYSNTTKYGSIRFIKSDLLKNIKINPGIIIANLPYGWHGVKNRFSSVKDGLKFEPQGALYTKEKGLFEIRRLLEQIAERKYRPRLIYLEFDPRQKTDLKRIIKKHLPKADVKFYKDLNNFWRYVEIK